MGNLVGCDPLKRRRALLQRASTHQRLCRVVWALGMADCRSTQLYVAIALLVFNPCVRTSNPNTFGR